MEESFYFPCVENAHQGLVKETLECSHQHECVRQRMAPLHLENAHVLTFGGFQYGNQRDMATKV